jgi:RsiW-degrading membrane proteinase PrsW (M82 family)
MDPTKFIPLTLDVENSTDCHLVLYQSNYYGCPICSVSDFTKEEGECVDGEMTVSYQKNTTITCNGVMKDTTESCGGINITIGLLLVGSLLLFIVIVGFIAVVYFFYQKNQKLSYKYKELRKTVASSVELEEVENSEQN